MSPQRYTTRYQFLGVGLIGLCCLAGAVTVSANPIPFGSQHLLSQRSQSSEATIADPAVQDVADRLLGVMDTSAQAASNPKVSSIQMTTCEVQVTDAPRRSPAIFLYQEQAPIDRLNRPYRQRFLQLTTGITPGIVQSRSFRPTELSAWAGLCQRPAAARQLSLQQLGTPVCTVFLKRSGEDYVGTTPADGCPANYRGAVRITNRIVLHSTGMDTWDRGLDAKGQQVWGAESEAYQFRRRP